MSDTQMNILAVLGILGGIVSIVWWYARVGVVCITFSLLWFVYVKFRIVKPKKVSLRKKIENIDNDRVLFYGMAMGFPILFLIVGGTLLSLQIWIAGGVITLLGVLGIGARMNRSVGLLDDDQQITDWINPGYGVLAVIVFLMITTTVLSVGMEAYANKPLQASEDVKVKDCSNFFYFTTHSVDCMPQNLLR